MTQINTEHDTGRDIEALALPLARALHNVRKTIAGWDEAAIWKALDALHNCAPVDPGDPDLCEAERILGDALDRANAERMARNAPWLAVDVACDKGRWTLTASHDQGNALRREFATFEEAKAAGDALFAFLGLAGRAHGFSYQQPPRLDPLGDPDDLDPIPF